MFIVFYFILLNSEVFQLIKLQQKQKNYEYFIKSPALNLLKLFNLLPRMNFQSPKPPTHTKKLSDISYQPIRDISHLSPYHQRVTLQKKYLQKKQQLRSILIMAHMQKMELNAINNRSIETMRKMRVAEEMSKKRFHSVDLPEEKSPMIGLKIDNRKKIKGKNTNSSVGQFYSDEKKLEEIQKVYEKLIDDYLQQVSKEKLLQKGIDRKKIIDEACATIRAQMSTNFPQLQEKSQRVLKPSRILNQKRNAVSNSQKHSNLPSISHQHSSSKKSNHHSNRHASISTFNQNSIMFQNTKIKRNQKSITRAKPTSRYRSLTEVECNENLKQLQVEQNYLSKQRIRDEKLFLRKMKLIGVKNVKTLKKGGRNE